MVLVGWRVLQLRRGLRPVFVRLRLRLLPVQLVLLAQLVLRRLRQLLAGLLARLVLRRLRHVRRRLWQRVWFVRNLVLQLGMLRDQ